MAGELLVLLDGAVSRSMTKGIAPNCRRVHFDAPEELYALIAAEASSPPAVSVAEWCRRLAAWRVGYNLPTAAERKEQRVRLTGEPKKRSGPKPKYLSAHETVPCGTEDDDAA